MHCINLRKRVRSKGSPPEAPGNRICREPAVRGACSSSLIWVYGCEVHLGKVWVRKTLYLGDSLAQDADQGFRSFNVDRVATSKNLDEGCLFVVVVICRA